MVTIDFNMEQNLIQIQTLKNARIRSDYNMNLLHKRQDFARREVLSLRKFASRKEGGVADYCNELADLIESRI